ncbi:MAG: hypothetical protein HOQ05_09855 [Corynebacteriales bacterium]|nr:hypothetical protein [Mycobacteriales bacterium]
MTAGPLSARVAALCNEVSYRLGGTTRASVGEVSRRLGEPLRVAIAGRLKAGKSTLVNALIGRRVAPTEVGECTRVVTQFRYGTADRVDVARRAGPPASLPLDPHGMIPQRLGVPRPEISHVDVSLTTDRLREMTVIDTPGLSSTNTQISAGTQAFLFDGDTADGRADSDSENAISGAEAIIYVFTQSARTDDVAALEAFRSMSARWSANPINSIGLFNKADKTVAGGDPWPTAGPLAADMATALRRQVADVVPVIGLLAETTEAGRLTAADCEALRSLAALSASERTVLTASADLFKARQAPVDSEQRARLVELLDLYGIQFAMAQFDNEPSLGTSELVRRLHLASGFPRVRQTIDQALRHRADAIKAGWALSQLEAIAARSGHPGEREYLRSATEQVLRQPEYHQLRLIEAAQQVATGAVALPADMETEVSRLALSNNAAWILNMENAPPQALEHAALQAASRWRAFAVSGANPAQSRIADVIHRGYYLLAQRLKSPPMNQPMMTREYMR